MYGWNWFLLVLGFCPSMWLACPYLGWKLVSSRDLLPSSILTRIAEYDLPFFVNFYMNRLLLRLESCFTLFSNNFTQWMIKCFYHYICSVSNVFGFNCFVQKYFNCRCSNCQVTYNCLRQPYHSTASLNPPQLRLLSDSGDTELIYYIWIVSAYGWRVVLHFF